MARRKILVVDDEPKVCELVKAYLEKDGFEVILSGDGKDAVEKARMLKPDLIVLDLNLPGMDGFQFLERFRAMSRTSVMILSAREADEDVILGLGAGADDFVTKPCPPRVLAARARAHLRRSTDSKVADPHASDAHFRFGPYDLDVDALYLRREGKPVSLSAREFGILSLLAREAGRPLNPQEIYDAVWGAEFGDIGAVGVYIQRLRRKLEDDPSAPLYIQTVHGFGYRFNCERPTSYPDTVTASDVPVRSEAQQAGDPRQTEDTDLEAGIS